MQQNTTELSSGLLIDSEKIKLRKLVVHNDEVNTFEWVIETLVKVCGHTREQAEQCSLLIHYKGKYGVKSGSVNTLKPLKDAILERGIKATIE